MAGTLRHTLNMANSIIGVSILSMPYCFKESGLVLGIFLILFSGFITKKTCMFLIKAAIMSRRRSYELLAFQVFGVTGKLLMELCMILFLIGICISFHVVMGDLAPSIVAKYMVIENSPSLRCILLVGMMLLVILPLCLLRNLESLASMSACSICFYIFLTCIMSYFALPNLLDGSWIHKAELFQFNNAFRAFPIMTLALSCQSNVFEIYDSIPDPDVVRMKSVVSQAVNICCGLYIGVGFLGYVAFVDRDVGGNIIMSFPVSHLTDGITMFFVFSLAISFPLILFPCRTSIHSLIYKRNAQLSYDIVGNYMPESRFKIITLTVLTSSLVVGIMLPNIEFVLGLLGSTMGVIIALILPAVFYIKVYTKTSLDRLLAQGFFLLGILLMVMGTYLHLSGLPNTKDSSATVPSVRHPHENEAKFVGPGIIAKDIADLPLDDHPRVEDKATGRKEPAIPEPPDDPPQDLKKGPSLTMTKDKESQKEPLKDAKDVSAVEAKRDSATNQKKVPLIGSGSSYASDVRQAEQKDDPAKMVKKDIKEEDLHPDAIKKEEKENAEEERVAPVQAKENIERKQEQILKQMEHQQKEQKKLIEEQKKILQQLKNQQILENEGVNGNQEGGVIEAPNGGAPANRISKNEQLQQPAQQQQLQQPGQQQQLQQPGQQQQQLQQPVQQQLQQPVQQQQQQLQQPVQQQQQLQQSVQQQQHLQQPVQQQQLQQPVQQQPVHQQQQLQQPVHQQQQLQQPVQQQQLQQSVQQQQLQQPFQQQQLQQSVQQQLQQPVQQQQLQQTGQSQPVHPAQRHPEQLVNQQLDQSLQQIQLQNQNPSIQPLEPIYLKSMDSNHFQMSNLPANSPSPGINQSLPRNGLGESKLNFNSKKEVGRVENKFGHQDSKLYKQPISSKKGSIKQKGVAKIPSLPQEVKHDEERRKRDLVSVSDNLLRVGPNSGEIAKLRPPNYLSAPSEDLLKKEVLLEDRDALRVDALYDTRHLLSFGYKTRRRKRRHEQFPEYWDEM